MKRNEYVAAFLFTDKGDEVLLIEKNRPEWQKGLLNGIGGKVENGETIYEAMRREFREETSVDIDNWIDFARLNGKTDGVNWSVHFFYQFGLDRCREDINQTTDEVLKIIKTNEIYLYNTIPNLNWLIPMALTIRNDKAVYFGIIESY